MLVFVRQRRPLPLLSGAVRGLDTDPASMGWRDCGEDMGVCRCLESMQRGRAEHIVVVAVEARNNAIARKVVPGHSSDLERLRSASGS